VVELERGFEGSLVENGVAEVGKWWLRGKKFGNEGGIYFE
jgi:hypothetical protein